MARKQIGLALEPSLVERVDAARGDVPRARWIARALEAALASSPAGGTAEGAGFWLEAPVVPAAVEEAPGKPSGSPPVSPRASSAVEKPASQGSEWQRMLELGKRASSGPIPKGKR